MNEKNLTDPRLRERAQRLCAVMKEVSGHDPLDETRRRAVVMARMMVASALLAEGYTENAVGTVLGWDHSTIHHYRKRMKEVMTTPGYEAEKEILGKFKKCISI